MAHAARAQGRRVQHLHRLHAAEARPARSCGARTGWREKPARPEPASISSSSTRPGCYGANPCPRATRPAGDRRGCLGHWRTSTFLVALRCDRLTALCALDSRASVSSIDAVRALDSGPWLRIDSNNVQISRCSADVPCSGHWPARPRDVERSRRCRDTTRWRASRPLLPWPRDRLTPAPAIVLMRPLGSGSRRSLVGPTTHLQVP